MTKKYKCSFYILLSVLFLMVQINCGRVSPRRDKNSSQAFRRQNEPPPGGPPGGPPEGPPGGPPDQSDGEPPLKEPDNPPARPAAPPENPDRPKPPEEEDPTEDPDEANSERPLHTVKFTDLPQAAMEDALILDYGRYTITNFQYEANQWMHSKPIDLCYDDYTKCYTSMIAPIPVCMMYSTRNIKTVHSYCDAYFFNCRLGYRYWRIVGYGKCIVAFFGFPELEDT